MAVTAAQDWALYALDGALSGNRSTVGGMTPNGKNQADLSHIPFYNSAGPDVPFVLLNRAESRPDTRDGDQKTTLSTLKCALMRSSTCCRRPASGGCCRRISWP